MQMAHVFEARTRDRMFQLRSNHAACRALTAMLQGFVAMPGHRLHLPKPEPCSYTE